MSCGIPSPEPLITASALTPTATAHHINVSFDRTLTAERVFSARGSASVFSSRCVHVSVCACTSHHSKSSNHTCVCGEPASVEKKHRTRGWKQNEVDGRKQPDKSSFSLTCKLGSELPTEGGRGRSNTTCALDPITSFITGRHTSTQMAFTTEVPPLALRERGYKRRRGREELYCHSKSKQQLESASRTNMTAFCSVEISQPSASLLSRRICQ